MTKDKCWKKLYRGLLILFAIPMTIDCYAMESSTTRLAGIEQHLLTASREFIGRPYRLSPLGEGRGVDADPLIRFDAFDCTTYIETVIAVSRAETEKVSDSLAEIRRIRYSKGVVDFNRRRHLPAFQWLPELIENRILADITKEIGRNETHYLSASLSPEIWRKRKRHILPALKPESLPVRKVRLPYIRLDDFNRIAPRIKETAILSVVRPKASLAPVIITHQALLIPRPGKSPLVRHARKKPVNRVVEEPLARFLARLKRKRRPPVLGINVADILDPAQITPAENDN